MSRIGLSNYIDCKSTNGGDGDVVSCAGCEPGHEVEKVIRSQVTNPITLGIITYLIKQNIGPTYRLPQMHPQLSDKKLGYSLRL